MTPIPFAWRCRSAVACIVIPVLVNAISFKSVVKRLGNRPRRSDARFDDESLSTWVNTFLHRLPDPWYPTCLRRGAVLYHLLRRAGRSVDLCLGVQRKSGGAIDAHAWLTKNDEPYLEPPNTNPAQYKLIARFPEGASDAARESDQTYENTGA